MKDNRKAGMELMARTYYQTAYQVALGIVGNRDDAQDATQEAFIRVQRSYDRFDDSRSFFPWLYTILANLCKTTLTRRNRSALREVEYDELHLSLNPDLSPEDNLLKSEELKALRKSLSALSFEDREIITLKHFQEFSYEDIAHILAIPRGTVMSRLYYARKRLATAMQETTEGANR